MLIEYVPFGDLLGYLRKSRGLSDTYYKDPDIKPQTNLTSQQLIKFAWQIADGMSYLSSIPVSDVTILWVMSLENKAHTHYTLLIIDSWTPHSQGCHVIPCQLSLNSLKGVFQKKHLRFVEGYPSRSFSSYCVGWRRGNVQSDGLWNGQRCARGQHLRKKNQGQYELF